MKQITKGIKIISILFLTLTFFVGCEEDDDNQSPTLEAGFTHTINQDTGTVTFINTSSNADSYTWDFGDDTASTEINPIHTYTSGTYTIVLQATNVAGASDSFEDVITIQLSEVLAFPLTFDNPLVNYVATTFSGAGFEVVENPDASGSNPTVSNVASIINSGAAFEGIYFDLETPLDLTTDNSIKMNFWSDTPIDVLVKLEEGTGADVETTASHGGTGWEEIAFTFNSTSSYSRITIFADGPGTNPGTFYLDDIQQTTGATGGDCTVETMQSLSAADFNLTFQNDPTASIDSDGAGFAWIDNPDSDNAVNASCKVGQIDRTSAAMFANNQIDLDAKLDFTSNTGFKLKVWSPTASTNVLLKLEDQTNAGTFVEVPATTSAGSAGQWEEITFNFASSDSNKYDKIVLFFQLGTSTQETYYIDDFTLISDGGGGGTFDDGLLTNGDFENGTEAWSGNALDVQTEGGNSFNFANVTTAGQPFDVNLSQVVEIMQGETYTLSFDASSDGNRTMLAGIGLNEAPWTNTTQSVDLTTETQTFTLTLSSADFGIANSRVIFDMGADTGVVVIDNVSLFCEDCGGGGGTGTCDAPPAGEFITDGGFEANAGCWQLIDNGGTVTISTTINNGGSNSGQIKTTPGSNPALKQERFGVGTILPNTTYVVQFDIQVNANDIPANGAVFQAFAFSEPAEGSNDGATQHILVAGDASFPTTWDSRTYTFTTAANVDGGLSLLLEVVCGGVAGCTGTVNIDNVSITAQ